MLRKIITVYERKGGVSTKQRLIIPNNQDTDDSLRGGNEEVTNRQSPYTLHLTHRRLRVLGVEVVTTLVIVSVPLSVHAGVFSKIQDFFVPPAAAQIESISYDNPADVPLLTAGTNPDPSAALGGGDIIFDESALLPSIPFGKDTYDKIENNGEISVYVVREGDALSQIAEMFGVTTNTILWANDIEKANTIQPGDSLVILPIVGVRHVVKSGDTISTISKKYESDAGEILSYNRLASASELTVGETLIIPGGNMHTAAPKSSVSKSSGGSTVVSTGSGSSGFTHPLPGAVRTQGLHGYNGVDLAAAAGTPIRAAASGEVIISKGSGWNGGYGNYVVVKHSNGTQTLYAHLSSNAVGVGSSVNAGETIGYVGSTGRSTGNHLHFEVRGATNPF